jgi:starvation-inducible DNA-binding protein
MNQPQTQPSASSLNPVVQQLIKVLSDTYVLGVKTHGAHWNVKGSGFFRLHAAFDEQYHDLLAAADELAERIRSLNCMAPASMRQLLEVSDISEPPADDELHLVRALRNDHQQVAKLCRKAITVANEENDEGTVDLLIGRLKAHEKTAWMLTATLGE